MKVRDGMSAEQLANELARDSIVTRALARYLRQVLECVFDEHIRPLHKRIAELEAALTAASPHSRG